MISCKIIIFKFIKFKEDLSVNSYRHTTWSFEKLSEIGLQLENKQILSYFN